MKIDKEQFNKLKQLDRIEFRQRQDRIKSWLSGSLGLPFLLGSVFSMAFILLLIPQGYNVWGIEFVKDVSEVYGFFIGLMLAFTIGGYTCDLIRYFIRRKNLIGLDKEYFTDKTEVKK